MTDNNVSIRAFFAIDLPTDTKEHIYKKIIAVLSKDKKWSGVHWSPQNHLHITLQFMPAIKLIDIDIIMDQAQRTLHKPFNLRFGPLEFFPDNNKPKILSLTILTGNTELANISRILGDILNHMDYPVETRIYRPHLTLGKLTFSNQKNLLADANFPSLEIRVEEIILFQSQPTKNGSIYIPLAKIPLKES